MMTPLPKGSIFQQMLLKLQQWRYLLLGLVVLLLGWGIYTWTERPIDLIINEQPYQLRLRSWTVATTLERLNVNLVPADVVEPMIETPVKPNDEITIQFAQPVSLNVDGQQKVHFSQAATVGELLEEIEVELNSFDSAWLDGQLANFDTKLSVSAKVDRLERPPEIEMVVQRAMPVKLYEDHLAHTFFTSQPTVGTTLEQYGISLNPNDRVWPTLDTEISPEVQIYLDRATPIQITADGRILNTFTQAETVGEVLAEAGVPLMGQDFVQPPADTPIEPNLALEVVRVREVTEIQQEIILFETTWVGDDTLELDRQEVRQEGASGVVKTRSRVRYENGEEIWRVIEDEWLDQSPQDRMIAYGTNVVVRTVDTPNGPLEYWRKISMLATGYQAKTSGKAPDHPAYGVTRSGLQAGYGVVAVDPKVIPLFTELYVPDYGQAIAGDTGGRVLGKHVDLGYDDDQTIPPLFRWMDVYILTPVPPANQIRYVLPQWPQR